MGNKNGERFLNGAVRFFTIIGFEFEPRHHWMKYMLVGGLVNMGIVISSQVIFATLPNDDIQEKTAAFTFLNYYFVSIGKVITLLYNRQSILEVLNEFRELYPSVEVERAYNLQTYLKKSLLIETTLKGFFSVTSTFYNFYPLAISLVEFTRHGHCIFRDSLMMWYPFDNQRNWSTYLFTYFQQVTATYEAAVIILGLDLCLFGSLIQITMHFDIVCRNILQIEPDESDEAERKLTMQIAYHQRLLSLAEKINRIFIPSILFSLFSSSFIICFAGYQLLGEITIITVIKAFVLLTYELKQVIITCFLSDKLSEFSSKVSDGIYEHKWYNGTLKYKRLVLIVLMRSQKVVSMSATGISNVSLQTLREVISISYQIFTVIKSSSA